MCKNPLFPSLLEPVTIALYVQRGTVVKDPVKDSGSDDMVTEDLAPFTIRLVRGEYCGRFLISARNQVKEAMGALTVEREISHLVHNQEMELCETLDPFFEFILIFCLDQPFHQGRGICKVYPESLAYCFITKSKSEMSFSDAGRSKEDHILRIVDEP